MKYWMVDVFSRNIFSGNAAGVFLCGKDFPTEIYHKIALEFFQGESIFVQGLPSSDEHYRVRFFSPYQENAVPGYSLLAAAHVLWNELNINPLNPLYFETNAGIYKVIFKNDMISIQLPKVEVSPTTSPDRLFNALGTLPVSIYHSDSNLIVELHEEEEIYSIIPDFSKLSSIEFNRIILTCEKKESQYDYLARVFAPRLGHDEEAPNIHAHHSLGYFWAEQLDKKELNGFHVGYREGEVFLNMDDYSMHLSAYARTICDGMLRL